MKKLLALLAVVLCVVSCQTEPEGLDVNVGGEIDAIVNVTIPEAETRAAANPNSALGAFENVNFDEYTIRYILQVYYNNEPSHERLVKYSDGKSVAFEVRLVPGRNYQFVVWADVVEDKDYQENEWKNEDGLHYDTTDLRNISLKQTWAAMDETRDAFTATVAVNGYSSASNITVNLKRPFAKLRVVTTDMVALNNLEIMPTKATVEYTDQHYNAFNAFEGKVINDSKNRNIKHENFAIASYGENVDNGADMTLFTDYFFAKSEEEPISFILTVYDQNGVAVENIIKTNNFSTDIPVQRNYLTTIKGNVLTDSNNVKVTVENNGAFAGEKVEKIVEVGNATDLQEAINNSTEETTIVFGGDINLGDLLAGIPSTRAAATLPIVIPADKVVALDLNGFKLTTPFVEGSDTNHTYAFENHGSLTIQDSKGNGEIVARGIFNYGSMTLKSGKINACDGNGGYGVRNYEGAEFIMNGGSIVTSYEDGDAPTEGYDASPVRVDEGATAIINGGTINNVSNYTFAIDNYGTTTINDGTFTTIHTTIANSATMTINGGSFTCNGLEGVSAHALWADAGTTTINGGTFDGKDNYNGFNVDASKGAIVNINGGKFLPVHSGSLYGEGTIIVKGGEFFDKIADKYVDYDYNVVKKGEVYTLERKPDVAKIGEVGYTSVAKAVAAAQNGETIVFVEDVEQVDGVIITDKNITIDLNNKTFTVTNGANTNNRNFKVNGSSVVTIKNGTMIAAGEYSSGAYGTLRTEGSAIVTLENVKLYNYRGNGLNVKAYKGTTVTITNTEIYSQYGGGVEAAGGIVELTNVKIEQKGMYTAPYNSMAISVNGGGQATVNSGTYSTECLTAEEANNQGTSHGPWCAGVLNSGGTLIIKGGTFSNDNYGDNALATYARGLLLADTAANIQIEGGVFNAVKAIIDVTNNLGDASRNPSATISGGDFSADPCVSGLYASHLISVAEGFKVENNNGRWTVVVDPAAKIGNEEYATLQEAFNVGGEITLLRNVTVAETVVLVEGKTVVLDLNGKTLSGTMHKNDGAVVKNEGTLTVKNGTVKSTANNGGSAIANYGTLTIDNATINGAPREGESWPSYPINNYSDATVTNTVVTGYQGCLALNNAGTTTINDCNFTKNYEKTSSHVFYVNHADANVIINGGTYNHNGFDGSLAYIIKGEVTINDGTFNAKDGGYGVAVLSGGKVTVNGGTLPAFLNWGGQIIDNRTK